MALIPLTRGLSALVDDEDFEWLSQCKWYALRVRESALFYAARMTFEDGKRKVQRMHRVILNAGPSEEVDHRNGNGLDNRRKNLRRATRLQNRQNMVGKRRGANTSRFKGVCWGKKAARWRATINAPEKQIHLGFFDDEAAAARAYDRAARKIFGEFAACNFERENAQ